ncbi:MAG: HNH endonuclease [Flavonifractor plautii]
MLRKFRVDKNSYDHIIPLKMGGNNDPSNWQLTCERCNKSKGARSSDFKNIVFPFWEIKDGD